MRRSACIILSVLFFLISSSGCAGTPAAEQETSLLAQAQEQTPEPAIDQIMPQTDEAGSTSIPDTSAPKVESEQISFVTPTPEPTEEPTPTPTPTEAPPATDTPEPNPYTGVWTIEDLPFSLELRSDKTYLVTASESEREGTDTYDNNRVVLEIGDGRTVEMRYYENVDTFKVDDFKLIRDDLVFFYEMTGVPVSFTAENDDMVIPFAKL